jgi:hypothetical protein
VVKVKKQIEINIEQLKRQISIKKFREKKVRETNQKGKCLVS